MRLLALARCPKRLRVKWSPYNGEREKVEELSAGIVPAQSAEDAIDETAGVPEWARGE